MTPTRRGADEESTPGVAIGVGLVVVCLLATAYLANKPASAHYVAPPVAVDTTPAVVVNQDSIAQARLDSIAAENTPERLAAKAREDKEKVRGARVLYAATLEATMLNDLKMDATVRAVGPEGKTLRIKYALAGRVFHNEIKKAIASHYTNPFFMLDFNKLVTTDGYDDTWTTTW